MRLSKVKAYLHWSFYVVRYRMAFYVTLVRSPMILEGII